MSSLATAIRTIPTIRSRHRIAILPYVIVFFVGLDNITFSTTENAQTLAQPVLAFVSIFLFRSLALESNDPYIRANALGYNPQSVGNYIAIGLGILIAGLYSQRKGNYPFGRLRLMLPAFTVLVVGLIATASRG